MPVYTYHCDNCGHQFDKHQSFSENALVVCPECRKHQLRKIYSPARVVFKGSGFYVTDKKAHSSTSDPVPRAKSNGSKPSEVGESKSGESKTSESKAGESKASESKASDKKEKAPKAEASESKSNSK